MNKHLCLLVLSLLIGFGTLFSQDSSSYSYVRLPITTTISDYINSPRLNTYNINLGAEFYLSSRKSLAVNLGLIRPYGPSGDILFGISAESTSGYKLQLEMRHYFNKGSTNFNSGFYLAAHGFFQNTATIRDEFVGIPIENQPWYRSSFTYWNFYIVNRNVSALILKSGFQFIYNSGVTFGVAGGLGVQYISSSSTNRINSDMSYPHSQTDHGNKLFDHGHGFFPRVICQVSLGYSYRKKVKK